MSVTILTPISRTTLTGTAKSAVPSTSWRELVGQANRTLELSGVLACREIAILFGSSADSVTGGAATDFVGTFADADGAHAARTLTFAANATATKTVTIGTRVYTFVAALTAANQVLIGASASATLDNLIAAINAAAGAGTTYGTGTAAHVLGTAAAGAGDTLIFTATAISSSGNSIPVGTTVTSAGWGGGTLTGGITPSILEGWNNVDQTGDPLPGINFIQAIEVCCAAGGLNLTIGTKVVTLPIPAGGSFHYATPASANPGTLTLAATAADTEATVTIFYK